LTPPLWILERPLPDNYYTKTFLWGPCLKRFCGNLALEMSRDQKRAESGSFASFSLSRKMMEFTFVGSLVSFFDGFTRLES